MDSGTASLEVVGEILPGVRAAFTTRAAGNLAYHVGNDPDSVSRNRAQLALNLGLGGVQYMSQIHGTDVVRVESLTQGQQAPVADGLYSSGRPLAVMVADCVPILLAGRREEDGEVLIAAVHAGRPGLQHGIVIEAVGRLREAGAGELVAWLGPSVCGECYEVPADMQQEVAAVVTGTLSTTRAGTPALDLPAGVLSQLETLGVRVTYRGPCTLEHERFFSHRREPGAGRIAGLIWKDTNE